MGFVWGEFGGALGLSWQQWVAYMRFGSLQNDDKEMQTMREGCSELVWSETMLPSWVQNSKVGWVSSASVTHISILLHRFILLSDVTKIMYQLFRTNFVWISTGMILITIMPHAAWWEIGWGSSVVPPVSISSTSDDRSCQQLSLKRSLQLNQQPTRKPAVQQ